MFSIELKMGIKQNTVLLALLVALSEVVNASRFRYYSLTDAQGGCASFTCGTNAKCSMSQGRPVCSCLNLHMGDPLINCHKVECIIPEDCQVYQTCSGNECINPCADVCGPGANCEVVNHVPICSCPPGHTGDPFKGCRVLDPDEACKPSPCGINTKCQVVNEVPTCSCLPGFRGSPFDGCRRECENDADCPHSRTCSKNYKCESPCNCGESANCEVVNHKATCTCPINWLGSPYTKCYPECVKHTDCPGNKPGCFSHECVNPCEGACGVNANCELRGFTPICSCPRGMTGDPFTRCRPYEPEDLCIPNPCGENAACTPGHDRDGNERAICRCPDGYIGNALEKCVPGECVNDSDCRDNRACINSYCLNPCTGKECASNAKCEARRHIAVCSCLDGTRGDAVVGCNAIQTSFRGFRKRFPRT